MRLGTFSFYIGYNENNHVNLYAVSAKCSMFDGIKVFANMNDAGDWIHTLKHDYDPTIQQVINDYYDNLMGYYESAYMLGIRNGEYFVLQQEK